MKLHFLGTGSSFPTAKRGVSSLVLQNDDGSLWLFDCGEGTQIQLQKSAVTAQKITKIFVTHLHGDHLFGLPGLLCTISSQLGDQAGEDRVVEIYGPLGLEKFLTVALLTSRSPLVFKYRVHELVPAAVQYEDEDRGIWEDQLDILFNSNRVRVHANNLPSNEIDPVEDQNGRLCWPLIDDNKWCITAGWIQHRAPCFGFVLNEKDRPGTLDKNKLTALGLKPGPLYGKLKSGKSVMLDDGTTVRPEEVLGPPIPGRTLVILGDTKNAQPLAHLVSGCDVLVHEATHGDELADKANEYDHSTPAGAVRFAVAINAKILLLNHFSQRYAPIDSQAQDEESLSVLQAEAERAAESECKAHERDTSLVVKCTHDFFVYEVLNKPRALSVKS